MITLCRTSLSLLTLTLVLSLPALSQAEPEKLETDLLIVGGTESGWAAAIQAARMGVSSITIVHDGEWLGGQYTEQALACVDENKGVGKKGWAPDWHPMKRSFHRFGLFKELMDEIEALNTEKYGSPMPGLPHHGPTTFRPAEAESIFRQMLQPYIDSGQVKFLPNLYPVEARLTDDGKRLTALRFEPVPYPISQEAPYEDLLVTAGMTIDASDYGDVIQVSGTGFLVGPDPKERYGEPSAPTDMSVYPPNEMNPITMTMIVEEAEDWSPIPQPQYYDDRKYPRATPLSRAEFGKLPWQNKARMGSIPAWPPAGQEAKRQLTIYSVRRIVEGSLSKDGKTSILLCYSNGQDYPLENLPKHVKEQLEATEPGASMKNYVLMTREQRQIIYEDAKLHSQGLLYHVQNFVHERMTDRENSLRKFRLSSEFGTPDNMPPKPYIRESLRLKAMYMMREQDGRNFDGKDKKQAREAFSKVMYPDGLFSWQFHYDFHNTGRTYLQGDEEHTGPWIDYEKEGRHTRLVSDRSVFPMRSLIPEEMDGLLGAQKNIGVSSITSAAIRLHDHGVHVGQAAGVAAAICLREDMQPREMPYVRDRIEEIRNALCGGTDGAQPILLWPYRDLPVDHPAFVAINRLAATGSLPMTKRVVDFQPDQEATAEWRNEVLQLAFDQRPTPTKLTFPDAEMTRGEFAIQVWDAIKDLPLNPWPEMASNDIDGDGIPNANDGLPFNAENRSWPEESQLPHVPPSALLPADRDGIPADLESKDEPIRRFNFTSLSAKEVAGFTNDAGRSYDAERGYGWGRTIVESNRRRHRLPEDFRDTFLFTRSRDQWECEVENGKWLVTICVGDSGFEQAGQYVAVEGQELVDNITTAEGEFYERSATVDVHDGRLTVDIGMGRPDVKWNTCLNWLTLQPAKN